MYEGLYATKIGEVGKNVSIHGSDQKISASDASFRGICLPPSGIILVGI